MFSLDGEPNDEFKTWSEDYVLLLHVTSHVFTDAHHDLFADRGGFGFPYLAFLDRDGHVLAQHRGAQTVDGLRETADRAVATLALCSAAKEGDEDAQVALFVARLGIEALSFAEARAAYEELGDALTGEQKKAADQLLINREISEQMNLLRREHGSDFMRVLPGRAVEYFRAGKVPTNRLAPHFFGAVLRYARDKDDRELAEQAVAKAEELFGDDPTAKNMIEQGRAMLEDW